MAIQIPNDPNLRPRRSTADCIQNYEEQTVHSAVKRTSTEHKWKRTEETEVLFFRT